MEVTFTVATPRLLTPAVPVEQPPAATLGGVVCDGLLPQATSPMARQTPAMPLGARRVVLIVGPTPTQRTSRGNRDTWLGHRFGGAAAMSARAEVRSRASAKSPMETMPMTWFFSTTGSRRIAFPRKYVIASSIGVSGVTVARSS